MAKIGLLKVTYEEHFPEENYHSISETTYKVHELLLEGELYTVYGAVYEKSQTSTNGVDYVIKHDGAVLNLGSNWIMNSTMDEVKDKLFNDSFVTKIEWVKPLA